mmetsp:Transcript_25935/g.65829  ORF Transcript_25935/g.65829 Transcript_25935/m.65829 type:complete len:261 (-) Transcript_25935:651-1433(-)
MCGMLRKLLGHMNIAKLLVCALGRLGTTSKKATRSSLLRRTCRCTVSVLGVAKAAPCASRSTSISSSKYSSACSCNSRMVVPPNTCHLSRFPSRTVSTTITSSSAETPTSPCGPCPGTATVPSCNIDPPRRSELGFEKGDELGLEKGCAPFSEPAGFLGLFLRRPASERRGSLRAPSARAGTGGAALSGGPAASPRSLISKRTVRAPATRAGRCTSCAISPDSELPELLLRLRRRTPALSRCEIGAPRRAPSTTGTPSAA